MLEAEKETLEAARLRAARYAKRAAKRARAIEQNSADEATCLLVRLEELVSRAPAPQTPFSGWSSGYSGERTMCPSPQDRACFGCGSVAHLYGDCPVRRVRGRKALTGHTPVKTVLLRERVVP